MPAKKKSAAKRAPKKAPVAKPGAGYAALFDRVATILEQARANVVRAVNSHMVLAYWLIGREIVQEIQGGGRRAAYGKQVLAELSRRLTERFGSGFSETSLQYFRRFFLTYAQRMIEIPRPLGVELGEPEMKPGKSRPMGAESANQDLSGAEFAISPIRHPPGDELVTGFSPQISWSHYRALMRVENAEARDFYEREAIAGAWDNCCCIRALSFQLCGRLRVLRWRFASNLLPFPS